MTTPAPSAARYVGARVPRTEDPRLLTGYGTYVDDVVRPGMLHVHFVRSTQARARILDIDVAEDAAELVFVDYEPLPPVVDYATAQQSGELVHDGYPGNVVGSISRRPADSLTALFEGAAHVARETIDQQSYAAVPMETRGLVVEWSPPDGEMTIWAATQVPHEVRLYCSRLLGIPEHKVRVIMRDTGGGFGQKANPQREDAAVMLAARKVRAPLKWIEDRQENLVAAGQGRRERGEARIAFDEDGRILAVGIDHVQDAGAYPVPFPVSTTVVVGLLFPGPYRVTDGTFTCTSVFSNTTGRTAYRGPWQFETLAREMLIDIAGREMGIDPIELRRRNLLRHDELPFINPNGMPYADVTPLETYELGLKILDLDAFRREQEEARAQGRYLGVGTSSYIEPTTGGRGVQGTEGATIRIEPSGVVNVYVAGGSTGNSLETTVIQLTADALGVNIEDVNTIQGDTAVTPFGAGIGASGAPMAKMSEPMWQETIDVNLTGVWLTAKAAIPHLIAGGRGGSIILTSSAGGLKAMQNIGHYIAAKHGVVGLMRTLALELAPHMIRVNAVMPTNVNTPMMMNDGLYRMFRPDLENPTQDDIVDVAKLMNVLPIPWVEPEDISNAILFLASDESRYITGVPLPIDAGSLLK